MKIDVHGISGTVRSKEDAMTNHGRRTFVTFEIDPLQFDEIKGGGSYILLNYDQKPLKFYEGGEHASR